MVKAKQKQKILNYMREHGSITKFEGFTIGITKADTRISELIQDGYNIRKVWVDDVNRGGDRVRYIRYSLASDKATA